MAAGDNDFLNRGAVWRRPRFFGTNMNKDVASDMARGDNIIHDYMRSAIAR